MTENQFYVLISVLGAGLAGIGAAIRFSVGRVVRALDLNTETMLGNTKSNAVLSTKIDSIGAYVERRSKNSTPPATQGRSKISSDVREFIQDEIEREISGVHDAAVVVDPAISDEDGDTPVDGPHARKSTSGPKGGYQVTPKKRKVTEGGR